MAVEPGSLSSKDYVDMIYSNALILGSSDVTTPMFSGMNLGDVMRVTVMQEMDHLKMNRNKPLDLSCKPADFSCSPWDMRKS